MKVKVKKLVPTAKMPQFAHASDAGADLTITSVDYDFEANHVTYGFGIAVEIPTGYVGLLFPRSSICKTGLSLTNSVGVIDSGYRGEIKAVFSIDTVSHNFTPYKIGDKGAQLVIVKLPDVAFEESGDLSESDRMANGYGSTGR